MRAVISTVPRMHHAAVLTMPSRAMATMKVVGGRLVPLVEALQPRGAPRKGAQAAQTQAEIDDFRVGGISVAVNKRKKAEAPTTNTIADTPPVRDADVLFDDASGTCPFPLHCIPKYTCVWLWPSIARRFSARKPGSKCIA